MKSRSRSLPRETVTSQMLSTTPAKSKTTRRSTRITATPKRFTDQIKLKKVVMKVKRLGDVCHNISYFSSSSSENDDSDCDETYSSALAASENVEEDFFDAEDMEISDIFADVDGMEVDGSLSDKENRRMTRSSSRVRQTNCTPGKAVETSKTPKTASVSRSTRASRNLLSELPKKNSSSTPFTRKRSGNVRGEEETPSKVVAGRLRNIKVFDDDEEGSEEYDDDGAIDRMNSRVARIQKKTRNPFTPIFDANKKSAKIPASGEIDDNFPVLRSRIHFTIRPENFLDINGISKAEKQTKKKPPITPIRLKLDKTPGGTRRVQNLKFLNRRRDSSDDDSDEDSPVRTPIPKVRIPRTVFDPKKPMTTKDKLRNLSNRLHLSEVPPELPGRELESQAVRMLIEEAIDPKEGESRAMYIGGAPGTGKTATVRKVIETLQKSKKNNFIFTEVNAKMFRAKVFVEIYNGIQSTWKATTSSAKMGPATARKKLNDMLKCGDRSRPPIVILIDELDALYTKKQDVLYDIFDWTAIPESRVTIIAIANTVDFPERMLCQRISSRLDKRRLIFQPYEYDQIEQIIHARIFSPDVIAPDAVKLVSRKIAAISGDLRQALDLLRRAIRCAINGDAQQLTVQHVMEAQQAVSEPPRVRIVKGLKLHQMMVFRAVLSEIQTTAQEEVLFMAVYRTYCIFCNQLAGREPFGDSYVYEMLLILASCSLVRLVGSKNCGILQRRIRLCLTTDEAEKCIRLAEKKNSA
ncbi:unnamed protein product [Caenorhabditis auriculariae]|uniref:Origin recognition complex subunit 1 n=1 Tax=Caenorhabditis auriculariae TaxID=2777116 RepID=A0A8S1HMG6_9PELO|nr:unnamed protein product [Caenorhabditis auriculariae]